MIRTSNAATTTEDRDLEDGIDAIIYLQAMNGIEENRLTGELAWNNFTKQEKDSTLFFYRLFKASENHK